MDRPRTRLRSLRRRPRVDQQTGIDQETSPMRGRRGEPSFGKFAGWGCLSVSVAGGLFWLVALASGTTTTTAPQAEVTPRPTSTPEPLALFLDSRGPLSPVPALPIQTPLPIGRVGQRIVSGGVAITVVGVRKAQKLQEWQVAKSGHNYIVAETLIENGGRETASYAGGFFTARDSQGFEYSASGDPEQALLMGQLRPGEKVRGKVAFHTPATAVELVMSYGVSGLFRGADSPRILLN